MMFNLIKMMTALIVSVFASIIKGIGKIFNNIGAVMKPGEEDFAPAKDAKGDTAPANDSNFAPANDSEEEPTEAPATDHDSPYYDPIDWWLKHELFK